MSEDNVDRQLAKKKLVFFMLFLVVFSAVLQTAALHLSFGKFVPLLMWSPALAAFLSLRLVGDSERNLPWCWGKWEFNRMGYWLPVAYASIAYLFIWGVGLGGVPNADTVSDWADELGLQGAGTTTAVIVSVSVIMTGGFLASLGKALGEEIGWRGFFIWELRKLMPFEGVALVSGAVWASWHFPLLILGGYNNGASDLWIQLGLFTLMVLSVSVMLAYLTFKSGSLWPAAILHGAHNIYIQKVLTPLTTDTGNTAFWVDEFGVAVPTVSVLFAIYFWRRARAEGL